MAIFLAETDYDFPALHTADADGLLVLTEDFTTKRLVHGYIAGAFPWFERDGFYWWFAPHERCILFPAEIKISNSMKQVLRNGKMQFTFNQHFETVMQLCANTTRKPVYMDGMLFENDDTWITQNYIKAYTQLHQLGLAVSGETWQNGKLVGGLYGVLIGKVFYGESMFSLVSNASKYAFINTIEQLRNLHQIELIDCQQPTPHLLSLGARNVASNYFEQLLAKFTNGDALKLKF
jgi:leucyl/phenylalanyl-tRNA---protein transferase